MLATCEEMPQPAKPEEAEPSRSDLKTGEMRAEKTGEYPWDLARARIRP